jgi:hypothetical protein
MLFSMAGKSKTANMLIKRMFHTYSGQLIVSAIFGIALAFMFQRVCKGGKCIIIEAPPNSGVVNKTYEFAGECYTYTPVMVKCDTSSPAS